MNSKDKEIMIDGQTFLIKPSSHTNWKGETCMRFKVYSKNNPNKWIILEPNKDNPEKLDLIGRSKNQ